MIIFYKRKYHGALDKIKELKKEIDKKDETIEKLQDIIDNKRWSLLCELTTEKDKNAKLVKDIEKQKELNKELTIVNSDLNFKNECLSSNIKELKKEISKQNRKIENLKKIRVLPSTKAPNQLMKVKLSASSKPSVRNHIKNEII